MILAFCIFNWLLVHRTIGIVANDVLPQKPKVQPNNKNNRKIQSR